MFKNFQPTWHAHAIYDLTPEILREHGIKAILTDLDNTLIAWNNPHGTNQLRQWLQQMKAANMPVMVVSNNSYQRVGTALADFALPYVAYSLKPLPFGIKKALHRLQVAPNEVALVGDQLLTDIWAGHISGIRTILVDPIVSSDAFFTKFNRMIEKIIFHYLDSVGDIN